MPSRRSALDVSEHASRPRAAAVARKLEWFASRTQQAIFVGGAQRTLEWANEAACSLCGLPLEDLLARRLELFPDDPDAERRAAQHVSQKLSAGETARLEAAIRHRDGRALWIDLQVMPVPAEGGEGAGWVAIAEDITERKRAQAALADSEERYRNLVEGLSEPVAVHSQGRLVYANRAAIELLGTRSPEKLLGRPVFDFLHPDCHALAVERILKMELVGEPAEPVVQTLLRIDGTPVDVEVSAAPIVWRGEPAIQLTGRVVEAGREAEGGAGAPCALVDLASVVLELAPRIEDRIAPRAAVSFDLAGALVAAPEESRALAELVCAVVAQTAAALPRGRGSLRLQTSLCPLSHDEASAFVPADALPSGLFALVEACAKDAVLDPQLPGALFEASFPARFRGAGPGLAGALRLARAHRGALRVTAGEGELRIALALPAAQRPLRARSRALANVLPAPR